MNIKSPERIHVSHLRAIWKEAFDDSEAFLDSFERLAFSPSRSRCVFVDNEPVSVLYWFDCYHKNNKLAYIYAVATHPEHRSCGYASALLLDTHLYLKSVGYSGVVLVPASEALFNFYRRYGYEICSFIDELSCRTSNSAADLQELSVAEYIAKRREYLPENGVLEEGAIIDLLSVDTKFYLGSDFLLVAETGGEKLRGVELLGNKNRAADILCTLGFSTGIFRIPGSRNPFAMYINLSDQTTPIPSYFGLALD